MKRRELLVASGAVFAGCVGTGDGDSTPTQPRLGQVTLDNRDATAHEFAVEVTRQGSTVLTETVRVGADELTDLPCGWSGRGPFEVGCTVGDEAVRADVDASDPDYAIVWVTVDEDGSPAVLESPEPEPDHVACGPTATGSARE